MQQAECGWAAWSFCSTLCDRTMFLLQSFDWHWEVENTARLKWKFHFSSLLWKDWRWRLHLTRLSFPSKPNERMLPQLSFWNQTMWTVNKEPGSQFCSCSWDCSWVWGRDTCLLKPSCHCSLWTAGHEIISLYSRCFTVVYPYIFIWTSLVRQCLSIRSLFLFQAMKKWWGLLGFS